MSAWKVALKSLHARGGGPLPLRGFSDALSSAAMNMPRRLGLVEVARCGRGIARWNAYRLTDLGHRFVEGRVTIASLPRGRYALRATWLA